MVLALVLGQKHLADITPEVFIIIIMDLSILTLSSDEIE